MTNSDKKKVSEDEKSVFTTVTGLWPSMGKPLGQARVEQDIIIPAGTKLLLFENGTATAENRRPHLNLVHVPLD